MSVGSNGTWQSLTRLMEVRLPRYLIDMKLFFLADSPLPGKNSLHSLRNLYWYMCCQIKLPLPIHGIDFLTISITSIKPSPLTFIISCNLQWMIGWSPAILNGTVPVQAVPYLYPHACGRPKTVWTRILAEISNKFLNPNFYARPCQPCVKNYSKELNFHVKILINHNTYKDSV